MKFNRMNNFVVGTFCLSLSAMLLFGCKGKEQNVHPGQELPKLPVAALAMGNAEVVRTYSSSVEGVVNVEIRPQVSGYLSKILVDEGAYVKAGEPLFIIDDKTYREQLNTAMAALHTAEANLEVATINVDKQVPLVNSKVVSDITLQTAKANQNAAKAAVEQASSQVQAARINVGYCVVKAPVSGYLGRIPYRLGSLVSPSTPEPLTLLSDIHNINVYFSMAESDFIRFQKQFKGETIAQKLTHTPPVQLQLADGELYSEKGKLSAVDGQFNKNTGAITLRATFNNAKATLRSGNTAKILIPQTLANIVLVPIASTIEIQDKIYVFKVEKDNKVKQTVLEIDGKSGSNYIVSTGLASGDKIVTQGFERLQDNMTILPEAPQN